MQCLPWLRSKLWRWFREWKWEFPALWTEPREAMESVWKIKGNKKSSRRKVCVLFSAVQHQSCNASKLHHYIMLWHVPQHVDALPGHTHTQTQTHTRMAQQGTQYEFMATSCPNTFSDPPLMHLHVMRSFVSCINVARQMITITFNTFRWSQHSHHLLPEC